MKKLILLIFLTLGLTIAASLPCYSQTSDLPTAPTVQNETIVGKNETVSFLIRQNKNAREVIAAQEQRISELEAEVALEQENSQSVGKSYEAAKAEIVNLKSANESLRKAVATNEQTIALLQSDNAKKTEKAKKATKAKYKAYGVTVITLLLTYLLNR